MNSSPRRTRISGPFRLIAATALVATGLVGAPFMHGSTSASAQVPPTPTAISGTVFQDTRPNGVRDTAAPAEAGVQGVTVTAYGPFGAVAGTATSTATGDYSITPTGAGPWRLEFTTLPPDYVFGRQVASDKGTSVRFVTSLSGGNDLAVNLKMIDQLGGPLTYNHYPAGWAWAGSTPFQWMKQVASHFGGTRNPLVIAWPKGIGDAGGVRPQFHHVIDIAPTILEVAGISEPRLVNGTPQIPMEGVSMAYTFAPANASVPSRHVTQYFEMLGNRGMYQDGWKAASIRRVPWLSAPVTPDLDTTPWELYHVVEDFSEAHDVSGRYPQKLRELQDLFLAEAAQHHVLPIDDRVLERTDLSARPNLNPDRKVFTFFPGTVRVPEGTAPDLKNRSYAITADVELPPGGADGVLVTHGGRFGGYAFFVQAGRLHFVYNYLNQDRSTIDSTAAIPAGKVTLGYEFAYDGGGLGRGGTGSLFINGTKVGEGRIEKTIPYRVAFDETFDVGEDTGTPASESYQVPFRFGGKLSRVRVVLK